MQGVKRDAKFSGTRSETRPRQQLASLDFPNKSVTIQRLEGSIVTTNIGQTDRILRVVIGAALVIWGLATSNWLGIIGLVPLATAAMGWCPAYAPFGISTCKTKQ